MARGYVDPNFPNPMGDGDATVIIYGYTPNFALCILGIVFFALLFLAHLVQVIIYRTWFFLPLVFACVMEIIGYSFRSLSSRKNPYRVTYFVVQYFMIVVAPVLISASIYVCLTKVLAWLEAQRLVLRGWWLRKKTILWTFITIDVICTIAQVAGAALIGVKSSNQEDPKIGNDILLAGLAVQSFAYLIFLIILTSVIIAIFRDRQVLGKLSSRKHPFIIILALASILVFIRTIFRLVETSEGVFGYLSTHEAFFGALEFAPIVLATTILAVWFPGRWPTRDAVVDRKSEGVVSV